MTGHATRSSGSRCVPTSAWLAVRYVEQGVSASQIGVETGWSAQYVRDRLREYGIVLRPPGVAKAPVDRAALLGWLGEGLSVAELADRTGYSPAGVYGLLRRWQLPTPTAVGPAGGVRPDVDGEVLAAVARLYCDELRSLADVGGRFGRGPAWARARVLAAGVALRPGGRVPGADRGGGLDGSVCAAWYIGGLSVRAIATGTGWSATQVSAVLRGQGVVLRRGRQLGPEPDPGRLRALYVGQHLTLVQVAAELGCSTDRVKAGLAAAGIAVRVGGLPATAAALPLLTEALLRELYERQQLTMRQVADRVGGSEFRIARALDRFGIARRRPGARPVSALLADAEVLRQLYVEQRLDDTAIGGRFGVPAWRVIQRRRELGVRRLPVPPPHPPPVPPPPAAQLRRLYTEQGLPIAVIAASYRTSLPKVRRWLQDAGIAVRPRTARAHRAVLDRARLVELYSDRGWTAAQVAAELDSTVHTVLRGLHDHGIAVRRGGSQPNIRPGHDGAVAGDAVRLLAALYADRRLSAVLRRHRIPRRPQSGTIAERFPTPVVLTTAMLVELYDQVGLSARQIELLTGQPHEQVLDALHAAGLSVRRDSGPSPWSAQHR